MEPTPYEIDPKALRLRLILGKFQVVDIQKGLTGLVMFIQLAGGVKMKVDMPFRADVRVGDLLTFYTEVLADADAEPPPIQ